ncbi:helix-turn-helix domain-containing protein [Mailhella sp.]|uniref:helix-turn-helix domain-containing protein n=1 Tax=Mailhella sp. TaxID=1981029 RepID=UPI00406488BE
MKSFDLYDLLKNTSTAIIQARQAKDMTQRNLADETDISYSHMSDIENDKVDMGLNVFKRIATVLGLADRPEE